MSLAACQFHNFILGSYQLLNVVVQSILILFPLIFIHSELALIDATILFVFIGVKFNSFVVILFAAISLAVIVQANISLAVIVLAFILSLSTNTHNHIVQSTLYIAFLPTGESNAVHTNV